MANEKSDANTTGAAKVDMKELEQRTVTAELLAREAEAALRLYEAQARLKSLRAKARETKKSS